MHRTIANTLSIILVLLVAAASLSPAIMPASPSREMEGDVSPDTMPLPPGMEPVTVSAAHDPDDYPGDYSSISEEVSFYSVAIGGPINGKFYYPAGASGVPGVVFGVGFQELYSLPEEYDVINLNDYLDYDWIAEPLARWGYAVLVMEFQGDFSEGHALWIEEMNDGVSAMIDGTLTGAGIDVNALVDDNRIAVMGHNIGGAVAIAEAAADKRVKAVLALAPWDALGDRMLQELRFISPVPIQIQTGPDNDPVEEWGISGEELYNAAEEPKQLINIGSLPGGATPEGFTDATTGTENLITHQHEMSKYFAIIFLQYYFADDPDYYAMLSTNYTKGDTPPFNYHAMNTHSDLDTIIRDVNLSQAVFDVTPVSVPLELAVNLTPRGIGWGDSSISVVLEFSDASTPTTDSAGYILADNPDDIHNNLKNNRLAGEYRPGIGIGPGHTLDQDVLVTVNVKNSHGAAPEMADGSPAGTSQTLTFQLTASSGDTPSLSIDLKTPKVPIDEEGGEVEAMINGSDADGIGWYQTELDDVRSDWKSTSSDSFTLEMTVTESGNYEMSVRVKDSKGVESSSWKKVAFSASRPPVAEPFSFDENVKEGTLMAFDASDSYDPEGDEIEYLFDFGDGVDSNWTETSVIKHTYKENGDYTVKLTVRDEYGITDSHTDYIAIKGDSADEGALSGDIPIPVIGAIGVIAVLLAFLFLSSKKKPEEEADASGATEVSGKPLSLSPPPPPQPAASTGIPAPGGQVPLSTGPVPDPYGTPAAGSGIHPPALPLSQPAAPPMPPVPDDDEIIMPKMDAGIIYPKGYTPPGSSVPSATGKAPDDASFGPSVGGTGDGTRSPSADSTDIGSDDTSDIGSDDTSDERDGIVYPKGMKPS